MRPVCKLQPVLEMRVLYSFPHRIGASQICQTAWEQVEGLRRAGAEVLLATGSVARPPNSSVRVFKTLSCGHFRIPIRLVGRHNACQMHDWLVARMIPGLRGRIDLIHTWPLAATHTARAARKAGIPIVLERPNAHTRYAFQVVADECDRLGYKLPAGHEHKFNRKTLEREELEYALSDFLLCPSEFVAKTFINEGYNRSKLLRHQYGYDETRFQPVTARTSDGSGLRVIYAGVCAPRKGLHTALKAWLKSGAAERGKFIVCGSFVKGYKELLGDLLEHPSIEVLGHCSDLESYMANSDVLILPTIEEGSALVTYEAMASGCVLLVSDASGAPCSHMVTGLVHKAGDVDELTNHITQLATNHTLLKVLRETTIEAARHLTWTRAGEILLKAYNDALARYQNNRA